MPSVESYYDNQEAVSIIVTIFQQVQERLTEQFEDYDSFYASLKGIIFQEFAKYSLCRTIIIDNDEELTVNIKNKHIVSFIAIDSPDNYRTNQSFGTLFSILDMNGKKHKNITTDNINLCGYCLYGFQTQLVISEHQQTHLFRYQPNKQSFVIEKQNLRIPNQGIYYYIDESKRESWGTYYLHKLTNKLRQDYHQKYSNSMISDIHSILLQGGIYIKPLNTTDTTNKCYVFHCAYPIAFILERCGGKATDGENLIKELPFSSVKKTQLICGSMYEMDLLSDILSPKLLFFD